MAHSPLRHLRLMIAALLALLALGATAAPAAPPPPALEHGFFGVNGQFLFPRLPENRWAGHVDAMAAVGIETVRYDASWEWVEPHPPVGGRSAYNWSHYDAVVAALARRGVRWLPIVDYSAKWASSQPGVVHAPPADFGAYARFAGALARRYGPNGEFWQARPDLQPVPVEAYEIWNEPNWDGYWQPRADPLRYGDLYAAARREIRAADPHADVYIGGLGTGTAIPFLRAAYQRIRAQHERVDGVGFHPYAGTPDEMLVGIAAVRQTLDELGGVDVPVVLTELGWPVRGTGGHFPVPEATRAAHYARTVQLVSRSDCGVTGFIPHTWITEEQNRADPEHWYGIARRDGTLTPTTEAYRAAIAEVRGPAGVRPGGPAQLALCQRSPQVSIEAVSIARATSARTPRGRRARTRDQRRCYRATVTLAGHPVETATARFRYPGRVRKPGRRRAVEVLTGGDGTAVACFTRPRTRRPARGAVRVSAWRADLTGVAVAAQAISRR